MKSLECKLVQRLLSLEFRQLLVRVADYEGGAPHKNVQHQHWQCHSVNIRSSLNYYLGAVSQARDMVQTMAAIRDSS